MDAGLGAPADRSSPAAPRRRSPSTARAPTFTFASQDGDRFECSLDGGAWQACASPVTYGGLANGTHTFAVRAVDAAGNVDGTPATRAWTVRVDGAPVARISVRPRRRRLHADAGASTDPDGGALVYRWQRDGAAAGTGATLHYAAPDHATPRRAHRHGDRRRRPARPGDRRDAHARDDADERAAAHGRRPLRRRHAPRPRRERADRGPAVRDLGRRRAGADRGLLPRRGRCRGRRRRSRPGGPRAAREGRRQDARGHARGAWRRRRRRRATRPPPAARATTASS